MGASMCLPIKEADDRDDLPGSPVGECPHRRRPSEWFPTIRLICFQQKLDSVRGGQSVRGGVHVGDVADIYQRTLVVGPDAKYLKPGDIAASGPLSHDDATRVPILRVDFKADMEGRMKQLSAIDTARGFGWHVELVTAG